MIRNRNKLCSETLSHLKNRITPVVYSGMENQFTTVYYNDYFDFEPIYNLMTDIDSIRQIGGYSKINLYFSSNGGDADCLFTLSDYFNQIDDIDIDLVVSGLVASAGFYFLLMIDNPRVNIVFNDNSKGLIHLADTLVSSRGTLSKEQDRYDWNKFREKDIKKLNEYIRVNFINKLKLNKEDRKRLNQGQDVFLMRDELEEVVHSFHNRRWFESEEFIETYCEIERKIEEGKQVLRNMEKEYKLTMNKEFTKNLTE